MSINGTAVQARRQTEFATLGEIASNRRAPDGRVRGEKEDWSDEVVAELTRLWHAGLSTKLIGQAINRTKNAVVGKAHRPNLPPHANPCRPRGPDYVPPPRKAPGGGGRQYVSRNRVKAAAIKQGLAVYEATATYKCRFPIGEPGAPGFRFCTEIARWNKPYCAEHCEVCYLPRGAAEVQHV